MRPPPNDFEPAFRAARDEVLPNPDKMNGASDNAHTTDRKPDELPFIDIAAWQGEPPPEREWAVRDRVPLRNVTLLSGEGGVGKSILALHLAAATALERDWLGTMPTPGATLVLCCEDDEHELHRRLDQIVAHLRRQPRGIEQGFARRVARRPGRRDGCARQKRTDRPNASFLAVAAGGM